MLLLLYGALSSLVALALRLDSFKVVVRVLLDGGLGKVDVAYDTALNQDQTPHEPMELVGKQAVSMRRG